MKKLRRILSLLLMTLLLTNCGDKELNLNEKINLTGTVSTKEITTDEGTKKVTVLNLEEPIVIDGESIHKIELDYDKTLKENEEITITGTLKDNETSNNELSYVFEVIDIDDILSYVNTFSNEEFSMTIPPKLIKVSTIKRIDNGFIVYSTPNMSNGGEVFRTYYVTNDEFKKINKNEDKYIEKITSNKEITVVIEYPTTDQFTTEHFEEYEEIINNINTIKDNIKIK